MTGDVRLTNERILLQMNVCSQGLMKYLIILCDECNNERDVERVDQTLKNIITDVNIFHRNPFFSSLFDNNSFVFQVVAKNPQGLVMTLVTKESGRIRRARDADGSVKDLI